MVGLVEEALIPIECIELCHFLFAERKVEHLEVLANAMLRDALWDRDHVALDRPANEHLRCCPCMRSSDLEHDFILKQVRVLQTWRANCTLSTHTQCKRIREA
jgi:hypothetical protein